MVMVVETHCSSQTQLRALSVAQIDLVATPVTVVSATVLLLVEPPSSQTWFTPKLSHSHLFLISLKLVRG